MSYTNDCVRAGAVVLFSPIFLLPGLVIMLIGASWGSVYFKAQMSVKREMSIAKAPVLGHFGATIAGLSEYIVLFGCVHVELTI